MLEVPYTELEMSEAHPLVTCHGDDLHHARCGIHHKSTHCTVVITALYIGTEASVDLCLHF
jgi:hypothetical protein